MDDSDIEGDGVFVPVKDRKKRGRDPNSPEYQLAGFNANGEPSFHTNKKLATDDDKNKNDSTKNNSLTYINKKGNSNQNKNQHSYVNNKYSPIMNGSTYNKYKHFYFLSTEQNRDEFIEIWERIHPKEKDIILTVKTGLILKTNNDNAEISLETLVSTGKVTSFKKSEQNSPTRATPSESYSVVIASMELNIDEKTISEALKNLNLEHRFCKRIIARTTGKPTTLIRIITSSNSTSEKLLSHGFYFKYRHYPVYPSKPPAPLPQPCKKCLSFDHASENCISPRKCTKCFGTHADNKCTSTLPPKCTGCGSLEHQAWSLQCPKRPTQPLEGIPNIPIKSINKKSNELPKDIQKSRIHSPITLHDLIINSYTNELNEDKTSNREDLILKLRKRFVANYNVDTVAVFSGSRVYILMFDLITGENSPTESINNVVNIQQIQTD